MFNLKNQNKKILYSIKTSKIKLSPNLMFFDDEKIIFNNVSTSYSFNLCYRIEQEDKAVLRASISVKKLIQNEETEVVWTLDDSSFINLVYYFEIPASNDNNTKKLHARKSSVGNVKPSSNIFATTLNTLALFSPRTKKTENKFIDAKKMVKSPSNDAIIFSKQNNLVEIKNKFNLSRNFKNFLKSPVKTSKENDKAIVINKSPNKATSRNFVTMAKEYYTKEENNIANYFQSENINNNNEIFLQNFPMNYEFLYDNSNIKNKDDEVFSREFIKERLDFSEFEYDTFCSSIIISGLKEDNLEIINESENYPSPCTHTECSILSSFRPSILSFYKNNLKKNQFEISNEIANMVFPLGIKICFMYDTNHKYPKPYKTFVNIIRNEKGEIFYLTNFHYFRQMDIKEFDKKYKINPLKEYTQFKNLNNTNFNENKFVRNLEIISKFIPNETILVPECISLVSRYPFINQMNYILKNILISNIEQNDLNKLIHFLVNQAPIPTDNQNIFFYTPFTENLIKLESPFIQNYNNFSVGNILDYFSIENVITIFNLIILEQKILFIEDNYNLLSRVLYCFITFIYPFSWVNPFIPILSLTTVKFLQSIIPFVMGIDEFLFKFSINNDYLDKLNDNNIVFVDIENKMISLDLETILLRKKIFFRKNIIKQLNLPSLPEKIEKFLVKEIKECKKLNNDYLIEEQIKTIFRKVMVKLLAGLELFLFMTDDDLPLFNNDGFVNSKPNDEKNFYKEFVQTQNFNQYILNEKQKLKDFKIKKKYINIYGKVYDNMLFDTHVYLKLYEKLKKIEKQQKEKEKGKNKKVNILKMTSPTKNNKKEQELLNNLNVSLSSNGTNDNEKNNVITTTISSQGNMKKFHKSRTLTFSVDNKKKVQPNANLNNSLNLPEKKISFFNLNIVLYPYFISKIFYEKDKIDKFVNEEIEKVTKNQNKKDNIPFYIVKNQNNYDFSQIEDDYIRYFINILNIELKKNKEQFRPRRLIKRRSLSSSSLLIMSGKEEVNLLTEWFGTLCTQDIKKSNFKSVNIIALMKNPQLRKYFSNLIYQGTILNNKKIKKYLNKTSFDELLKVIKSAFNNSEESENNNCVYLTSSLFIYYKLENNNFYYLYEDYLKLNGECKLWSKEAFWTEWFNYEKTQEENNSESDDDNNNESDNEEDNKDKLYNFINGNKSKIFSMIETLYEISNKLKIKENIIKDVIINKIAAENLSNDEFKEFQVSVMGLDEEDL